MPAVDGKRQQKMETLTGVSKEEAKAIRAKRVETIKKGEFVVDARMTMTELFDKFMQAKKKRLEELTIDRYNSLIATYLRPSFGTVQVAMLRKAHLIEAYDQWGTRNGRAISGRTIKHAHDLLRATLNWAVSMEFVGQNVAAKITPGDLPKIDKPEGPVLDSSEVRRLLDTARTPTKRAVARQTVSSRPWFHPAVAFAVYTGARRGEVLGLRWSDIDFESGTVMIRRSLSQPKSGLKLKRPKNDRFRPVKVRSELLAILAAHAKAQAEDKRFFGAAYRDDGLVFVEANGDIVKPWNFGAAVKDLVSRAGVTEITLHDLRDTHASLLAESGVSLEVISRRLGHSSIAITMDRYMHVSKERDADAAEAFERLIG
jgi:integrase